MQIPLFKRVIKSLKKPQKCSIQASTQDSANLYHLLKNQRSSWQNWLSTFNPKSGYSRSYSGAANMRYVYNSVQYPGMLLWLIYISETPFSCSASLFEMSNARACKEIRRVVPWQTIERNLIQRYNKVSKEKINIPKQDLTKLKKIHSKHIQNYLEYYPWRTSVNHFLRHQYIFIERLLREKSITRNEIKNLSLVSEWLHRKGTVEEWRGRDYVYYKLGNYKYWVMWYDEENVASINRTFVF